MPSPSHADRVDTYTATLETIHDAAWQLPSWLLLPLVLLSIDALATYTAAAKSSRGIAFGKDALNYLERK